MSYSCLLMSLRTVKASFKMKKDIAKTCSGYAFVFLTLHVDVLKSRILYPFPDLYFFHSGLWWSSLAKIIIQKTQQVSRKHHI